MSQDMVKNKTNLPLIFVIVASIVFINAQPLTSQLSVLIALLFSITLFSTLIILISKKTIYIELSQLGFILIFLIFIITLFISMDFSQSIKYIIVYSITMGILLILSTDIKWFRLFWSFQLITASIHVMITLISYFFTDLYISLFVPLLNEASRNFTLAYIYIFDFHAGIAGQTATNAFFISTGLALISSKIFSSNKLYTKIVYIFVFAVFLFALILTGKRGFLLANLASLILLNMINKKISVRNLYKHIIFLLITSLIFYFSYIFIPAVNRLVERFFVGSGDISSGRFELFEFAWGIFLSNPILGVGIDAFTSISYMGESRNIGAHNDWLQFLAEIGFIGTSFLLITVISVLIKTVKLCRMNKRYFLFLSSSLYFQIFFLFYSTTGMPFHHYSMLLLYMIFISIPYAVTRLEYSSQKFKEETG